MTEAEGELRAELTRQESALGAARAETAEATRRAREDERSAQA